MQPHVFIKHKISKLIKTKMLPLSLPSLLLLSLIHLLPPGAAALNTVADCGPSLLPLAPCAPFVQGSAPAPVRTCCENVDKLYKHNVTCLCVLLDNSGSDSPLPINATLALQLPHLCKLSINPSTCPGVSLPSLSPPSNVSLGASTPSNVSLGARARSFPMSTGSKKPRFMGFGSHHHSAEARTKAQTPLLLLLAMAAIFLTELT